MATVVSEELKTFFTGDASGLIATGKKADEVLEANARKEKVVSDYKKKLARETERAAALAPIKALEATNKAADAKVKAEKDAADKIIRQQKASSASNIVKELRGNFGANAKKKIGGVLQNSLGLSEDAAEGVVSKIARFAPYLTAAGAVGVALVKTFKAASAFAGEQAEKMATLSEEMRQTSRTNVFSSSAEGVDSLSDKLEKVKQQIQEAKQAQRENDPYGFGGGIFGGMKTVAGKAMQGGLDFAANFMDVQGGDSNFDKQAREQQNLEMRQRGAEQDRAKLTRERSEAAQRDLDLTGARLTLDQQTVAINDLQLQKEREMASAKYATLSIDDKEKVKAKYDVQMTAQEQLRTAMEARYNLALDIANLQLSGASNSQKEAAAAQMRLAQIREEYNTRKDITVEERRSMALQEQADQNFLINAERKAERARGGSLNRQFASQRRRENQINRDDRQRDQNDSLIDITRGMNGEIIEGTDRLTGQRRGPSAQYKANATARSGLSTGSLIGGTLVDGSFERRFGRGGPGALTAALTRDTGHDTDTGHGSTLISATNKIVDAMDINNAFQKQISMDLSTIAANWGFA